MRFKFKSGTSKIQKLIQEIDGDENNRRRTLWISIRNIQSMVIEGYDMFSNKHEYDSKLKESKKDYLDVVVDNLPVGWIAQPYEILGFYEFLDSASVKYNNEVNEK